MHKDGNKKKKIIPINSEVVLRKPMKMFNNNSHSINYLLLFT
jgi:hypothetical protein